MLQSGVRVRLWTRTDATSSNDVDIVPRRYVSPLDMCHAPYLRAKLAAGLSLLSLLVLLPLFFSRHPPRWPYAFFGLLTMFAFLAAATGLGLALWLFIGATDRFQAEGFDASYGPSVRSTPCFIFSPSLIVHPVMDVGRRHRGSPTRGHERRLRNLYGRSVWTASTAPALHILNSASLYSAPCTA